MLSGWCVAWRAQKNVYAGDSAAMIPKVKPAVRANDQYVVSAAESSKTGKITIAYNFSPPPNVIYDTLLDTNRIRGATASDASMSREVGGKFSIFSGAVEGENTALKPYDESAGEASIVWKWRFSTWQVQ